VAQVNNLLGSQVLDRLIWVDMKGGYSRMISCCADFELAETFFNSVTRRIFHTVGVDPSIEYVDSDFEPRLPPIMREFTPSMRVPMMLGYRT